MYTLYYLNKNLQIGTIKTGSLDAPILIPEDLVFCDLRKGIHFIKEPHQCIDFTDIERLFMQSEFNDISLIKEADYRKQNTYLTPLCPIDVFDIVFPLENVSYWFDEGSVLRFPQHADLPAGQTDVYLSIDNDIFYKVPDSAKDNDYTWDTENRLYFYHILDLIPSVANLSNYVATNTFYAYFANKANGKRTKTFTVTH